MRQLTSLLLSATCMLGASDAFAAETCAVRNGAQTVPLVELYTSEGCSSCPPADRWLSRNLRGGAANFLAFHVDYWDDIGWPDRFASPAFSQRQRQRVAANGSRTVYTPQVMAGAHVQGKWQKPAAWQRSLQEQRQPPPRAALTLGLQRAGNGWQAALGAAPIGAPVVGAQVWLARYVDAQTTQVRAGENRGVSLRHDRVVRQLFGPGPLGDAAVSQSIALSGDTAPLGVTAFVQDAPRRNPAIAQPAGSWLQSIAQFGLSVRVRTGRSLVSRQ